MSGYGFGDFTRERSELSRAGEIWLEEEDKEETLRCRQTAGE